MNQYIRKINWWVFALLCSIFALYPFIYFFIDRKFGLLASKTPELLNDYMWNTGFYSHIVLGGIALGVGWSQFSKKLRTNKIGVHRLLGKVYVLSVLISGTAGLYIGYHATGGIISKMGFISLAIVWLFTTIQAFRAVKIGKIDLHQNYMVYSYAACFAAVTLRIWLPLLTEAFGDFTPAYRLVAWLCWVPNLIVAYFIVHRNQRTSTIMKTT